MKQKRSLLVGAFILVFIGSFAIPKACQAQFGADQVHTFNPNNLLAVTGKVDHPVALSVNLLRSMPQTTVTTTDGNKKAIYAGIPLKDLLMKAGIAANGEVSGQFVTLTVIQQGGESTTLSPDDTKAVFNSGTLIIIADELNDKPLNDNAGPLALILPNDHGPAQIISKLARIRVDTAN